MKVINALLSTAFLAGGVLASPSCPSSSSSIKQEALRHINSIVAEHSLVRERFFEDPTAGLPEVYSEFPDFAEHLKTMTPDQLDELIFKTEVYFHHLLNAFNELSIAIKNDTISEGEVKSLVGDIDTKDKMMASFTQAMIQIVINQCLALKAALFAEKCATVRSNAFKKLIECFEVFPVSERALDGLIIVDEGVADRFINNILSANIQELIKMISNFEDGQIPVRKEKALQKAIQGLGIEIPGEVICGFLMAKATKAEEVKSFPVVGSFTEQGRELLNNLITLCQSQIEKIEDTVKNLQGDALAAYLNTIDYLQFMAGSNSHFLPLKKAKMNFKYAPLDAYKAEHFKTRLLRDIGAESELRRSTLSTSDSKSCDPELVKEIIGLAEALKVAHSPESGRDVTLEDIYLPSTSTEMDVEDNRIDN